MKDVQIHPSKMKPIGILGGGQLARMLALKAHEMGLRVAVLSEKADDPAAQVTSLWTQGQLSEPQTLKKFLSSCSLVTFESEFLDARLLERLGQETATPILPRPSDMGSLQDRLTQKELLLKYRLPTARFYTVGTVDEARWALTELGGQAVFKKRRFGYDGYGTFVVRSVKDLTKFLPELETNPHGFIAEAFVPFQRELAVMVARNTKGATLHLPFVESFQENSRCLWVKGPLKESPRLKSLGRQLEKFLSGIGYAGIMGIELFDTGRGGLLINELAPRVHNSGHYSLDALAEDQFTLHLKAILGQDLSLPRLQAKAFAMMNLLGTTSREPHWQLPRDIELHWYGKAENRPGRKMGHINTLAAKPDLALAKVLKARASFKV